MTGTRKSDRRRSTERAGRTAAPTPRPRSRAWWYAACLLVGGITVFANSFSIPFVYDDHLTVVDNPHIPHLWSLSHALATFPPSPVAGRPLVGFSLAVNYAFGGLVPWGYHALNLAIHLLAAVLLFGIVRRTLARPAATPQIRVAADPLAFASALIWLIHPLQTEVVDYVSQRTESMMGMFYLLTLYAAIRAMAADRHAARWSAAAVAASALGMACKEPMVTAPAMVLLYDAVFCAGSVGGALRARRTLYVGLAATWIILIVLVAQGPRGNSAGFSTGVSPATYLLNQAVMVVAYLRLAVWPHGLVLDYGATPSALLRDVWLFGLGVVALLLLTAAAWRMRPALAFLGTWFFVTLAPSSSLVPVATEVGAERRMYLPLAALVVLGTVGGFMLVKRLTRERSGWTRPIAAASLVAICLALGALTLSRNAEYQSEEGIWRTVLARRPHGRAHQNLAVILKDQGRREEALSHYRQAVGDHPEAYYGLGLELQAGGRYDEAIIAYRQLIQLRPDDINVPRAHALMGRALIATNRLPEALDAFQQALRMWPEEPGARGGLADVLLKQERFEDAARAYREYLRLAPGDADAHFNLGVALVRQDLNAEAVAAFERAVTLAPTRPAMRLGLGNALTALGRVDDAIAHYREGLKLAPDNVPLHNVLGLALASQGQFRDAVAQFEQSLALDPANPRTRADHAELMRAIGRGEAGVPDKR